ncbi:MAG: GNAT family N-acetyltransferase [Marinilabiliaceae bacterium]|nr:GNAT family N-acetyltransferase [Marinilabiliaceae bacterium]
MEMKPDFLLRKWQLSDIKSLAENANNINIWNNVRDYFPHPYTEKDAQDFIQMVLNKPEPLTDFAIEIEGEAVGGIGIVPQTDVHAITTEIGYWLGEKYWNRGIMSSAVKQMVKYTFENFPVTKIFAPVFEFNIASMRVLEKAGFVREAILKKSAIKNGKTIDLHYYGLIKE